MTRHFGMGKFILFNGEDNTVRIAQGIFARSSRRTLPSWTIPTKKAMFMEELGLQESGLDRLIQCSYALLGLISFLTAGSDECRAWTIKRHQGPTGRRQNSFRL